MKKIGRIIDYQSGWSWFQMDDAGELGRGDVIRVSPWAEGEPMRMGELQVAGRMGHALHFDGPATSCIAALADCDYVYLVRD